MRQGRPTRVPAELLGSINAEKVSSHTGMGVAGARYGSPHLSFQQGWNIMGVCNTQRSWDCAKWPHCTMREENMILWEELSPLSIRNVSASLPFCGTSQAERRYQAFGYGYFSISWRGTSLAILINWLHFREYLTRFKNKSRLGFATGPDYEMPASWTDHAGFRSLRTMGPLLLRQDIPFMSHHHGSGRR